MRPSLEGILEYYPEISGVHEACTAVPDISDDDYKSLVDSIAKNGLANDIILSPDGKLVDGRNRLLACFEARVEVRFETRGVDPWLIAYDQNIARRHLTVGQKCLFADAWREYEAEQAKGRMQAGRPKEGKATLPEDTGQTRDKVGQRVGVGGKSMDKIRDVKDFAPEVLPEIRSGGKSLEEAHRIAKKRKQASRSRDAGEKPSKSDVEMVEIVTTSGATEQIKKPSKVVFNSTNDSVDWASWTWNPVTGCEHGCDFCYAREIANAKRMEDYYPFKFEPTLHSYRLDAPENTKIPKSDDPRDGRVFVCSMADLFGKWVPDEWIEQVFESCQSAPDWEYLFLTKWPNRYAQMPLLEKAWYGASVIRQSDVSRVEKAMKNFDTPCTKWISLEPMLTEIVFDDLSWCDLLVIGGQTATNQPSGFVGEIAPQFDWVAKVYTQAREAGVPVYLKHNLMETKPGMVMPRELPR